MPLDHFFSDLIFATDFLCKLDGWSGWPFSGFGYEGGFWPVVARFVLVVVLLGAIALVLRLLFGPKGPLRGEGWETIQEANKRREAERRRAEEAAKLQTSQNDGRDNEAFGNNTSKREP